jgi:archaemetzincin
MLKFQKVFLFFIQVISTSCSSLNTDGRVVVIQPLGGFPEAQTDSVVEQLKSIAFNVIRRKNLPFPQSAYYAERNRYKADTLIDYLNRLIGKDSIIIGLSANDISTTKGKIKDWGVMGLGYTPGRACVVSTFRLSKDNTKEQFYKVALHEFGHTQGLQHCQKNECFMRDAEGGNPLDSETGFCDFCKNYLKNMGWNLN